MAARNSQALNSVFLIEITIGTELLILTSLQLLLFFNNQNILIWNYFVFYQCYKSQALLQWMGVSVFFLPRYDPFRIELDWVHFCSYFHNMRSVCPWFSCFSMQTMFVLSIIVSSILFFINSVVVLQYYIIFIAVVVFHFLSTLRLHSFFCSFRIYQ